MAWALSPLHFLLSKSQWTSLGSIKGPHSLASGFLWGLSLFLEWSSPLPFLHPHSLLILLPLSCHLNLSLNLTLKDEPILTPHANNLSHPTTGVKAACTATHIRMTDLEDFFASRPEAPHKKEHLTYILLCSCTRGTRSKSKIPFIHPFTLSFINSFYCGGWAFLFSFHHLFPDTSKDGIYKRGLCLVTKRRERLLDSLTIIA